MSNPLTPRPEDKFTFGLWTIGNRGRDPFGDAVRPTISPVEIVKLLSEVGAYGTNLHDNDLVPIDATAAERDRIVREFKQACSDFNIRVPMATVNLFYDPVFRDGALTANDPDVRAFAVQKTMRAMYLGAELGADGLADLHDAVELKVPRGHDHEHAVGRSESVDREPGEHGRAVDDDVAVLAADAIKFALEAKPNEPRGDIYFSTTGHYLGFIYSLAHPEMVGLNPEVAHDQMAGLNFTHSVAQAWEAGKLFHIDLNDQNPGRFDQDFRFGSHNPKNAFFLVKFLEDVGYSGARHFDAHAYRTEDIDGVRDFAHGCMKTYLVLKDKAQQWREDKEIQQILAEIKSSGHDTVGKFSPDSAKQLLAREFDRSEMAGRKLNYERLDQLTIDILLGTRS